MSDGPAIVLTGVGKRYTLFPSRVDGLLDAIGLSWLVPHRRRRYQRFWALRDINLSLPRGARVGIIGRNGAGKSTLLKLITGNVEPTEGTVTVHGEVQALLQTGSGMHPDFTGYENIRAALTYQGLTAAEIADAVADIEEFTELGPFLSQPFKAYSTGMQARLAFATATKVNPDILIIDEVLGVGDGYFLAKSAERMRRLIDSGASVLLVSHAMDQIVRFCEQVLWIDRGQVVAQGDALDVVKEYERYLRLLDERRLKGRNQSLQAGRALPDGDPFTDALSVRLMAAPGGNLRVATVTLIENDRPQETVRVGGPQDGAVGNAAGVVLEAGTGWSEPVVAGRPFRQVAGGSAPGEVVFRLYHFDPTVRYGFDVECHADIGPGTIEVVRQGSALVTAPVSPTRDWQRVHVEAGGAEHKSAAGEPAAAVRPFHWPGLGDLRIERVRMLDPNGDEQTVFAFGGTMVIEVTVRATKTGTFPCRPIIVIHRRSDGIKVTQQIGDPTHLTLAEGDRRVARLRLEPLNLGSDTYVFSVAMYRRLDPTLVEPPEWYDSIDRTFEFRVYGRPTIYNSVFQHPGEWEIVPAVEPAAVSRSA
jgi:ABC-type polysaccharide/polyol phosphate transport system ATPase subunit